MKKNIFKFTNLFLLLLVSCSLMGSSPHTPTPQEEQPNKVYLPTIVNSTNTAQTSTDFCYSTPKADPVIPDFVKNLTSNNYRSEFYVTTSGSPNGDGSLNHPWDLDSALLDSGNVRGGDIIWIKGGTYHPNIEPSKYNVKISGDDNNPVIVRAFPGERVSIDGGIQVYSPNVVIWGLEIFSSNTDRVASESGSNPSDLDRPGGLAVYNKNVALINNVVHDGGHGITDQNPAGNNIIYGNLSYNTGWLGPDRGHGHGYYGQNEFDTKFIYENIMFNNFSNYSYHIYGESGPLQNFVFSGNVAINDTFLIGGYEPAVNMTLTENYTFNATTKLGYRSEQNDSVNFNQNRLWNPNSLALEIQGWKNANISNNCISSDNNFLAELDQPSDAGSYVWDNNLYFSEISNPFNLENSTLSWSKWQSSTGFDKSSNYNTKLSTNYDIVVRPNYFENKRGNVIVYNWQKANSVTVDISALGLQNGDRYIIHNAQDFYKGTIDGVYTGQPITIPMTGWSTTIPIGWDEALGESSFPDFGVFVITTQP
ncbi:MAG: hypothetical protein CL609_24990 [Anaerolineaceae bacterium]|nr:hypothetical protein [Anaerolineaceae bacterium]